MSGLLYTKNMTRNKTTRLFVSTGITLVVAIFALYSPLIGNAAPLTTIQDFVSTAKVSQPADHTILFVTPTGVDAFTDTITIDFETGFVLPANNPLNFDLEVGTTGDCTTSAFSTLKNVQAVPGSSPQWGVGTVGQTVTFTAPTNALAGEIPANRCVRIRIGTNAITGGNGVAQITNPGTIGQYQVNFNGTFGDTGQAAVLIVAEDAVNVTATVQEALTFSISDVTIGFGILRTSGPRFASPTAAGSDVEVVAHTMDAITSSANGYSITVAGTTLTSLTDSITAIGPVAAASAPGTEQYGIRLTALGGSGLPEAPFNTANYAFDPTQTMTVAKSTTPSTLTQYSVFYLANIAPSTDPGSYATDMIYVATANF